jgi:hypothetical protein
LSKNKALEEMINNTLAIKQEFGVDLLQYECVKVPDVCVKCPSDGLECPSMTGCSFKGCACVDQKCSVEKPFCVGKRMGKQ